MNQPVDIDIAHQLGREEAKRRMTDGFGKLTGYIPGSSVTQHQWAGDTLTFTLEALGQRIGARMDVFDDQIGRAHV